MTKCDQMKLGDLCSFVAGNVFKTKFQGQLEGFAPFIKVSDFEIPGNKYRIHRANNWVDEEVIQENKFRLHPPNGVVFAKIGVALTSNRRRLLIRDTIIDNNLMCAVGSEICSSPQYLYYVLSNLDFNEIVSGSAIPYLTVKDLKEIQINQHRVEEQKAIAHILGSLDDKIEINQKMNETLEEIAKAIFKSWFVDFDPVRAKMDGRPTGLPDDISNLFPDELVDSEIGEIPKGWETHSLGEFTTLVKGRSYKSAELQDSNVALVTLKSFLRGGGYRHDGLKGYTGKFKSEQIVSEGDLVIALTDVTQAADVIGKPALVRSSTKHDTLVASLDVGIIRFFEQTAVTKDFCHYLMLTDRYTAHSLGYTSGTTVLHLAKDASSSFKFCLPEEAIVQKFSEIAAPLQKKIFISEKESKVLADLRDTLLPKLISSELQIPDAEKFLEEAGI